MWLNCDLGKLLTLINLQKNICKYTLLRNSKWEEIELKIFGVLPSRQGFNSGRGQFFCQCNFFLFFNKIHFFLLSSLEETSNLCYRLNKNQLKLSLLSKIELKDGVTLVPEKLSWVSSDLADICKTSLFQALSITYTQLHWQILSE